MTTPESDTSSGSRTWITRGVVGIVLATFFSDVGHEMVTALLPQYLGSIALGAAALGVIEGVADLLFSASKLGGGVFGHFARRKRPWTALGYLVTALATAAIALVHTAVALVSLRAAAWAGRGFRSPLRDFMLADEVGATHFGRAYGVERAADMLGAVAGPLLAGALLWAGVPMRTVILVSVVPAMVSVVAIVFMTRDRDAPAVPSSASPPSAAAAPGRGLRRLPRRFWLFVGGVTVFGLGDFSRTFLILIAAVVLGETGGPGGPGGATGVFSLAVLLYALHNAVSALAAYPAGRLGDRWYKLNVLSGGYALGTITNAALALFAGMSLGAEGGTGGAAMIGFLVAIFALSGTYIAVEETVEKATAAEMLPRDVRSLGLGVLAAANAIGDMAGSVFVGVMLAIGHPVLAFAAPAAMGLVGTLWMVWLARAGRGMSGDGVPGRTGPGGGRPR